MGKLRHLTVAWLAALAIWLPARAIAAPVVTAPTGDLNQDGIVTVADLQCQVLVLQRWLSVAPVLADSCGDASDCPAGDSCAATFGAGFTVCMPGCLAPPVTLGPAPDVSCGDTAADDDDCHGLVHKRSADLDCSGEMTNVDMQYLVQLVMSQTGGPGTADMDSDGVLNLCDADSDGDGDPDASDCADFDAGIYTDAPEACDGIDNDCDGHADAADPEGMDTGDADGDGVCDDVDVCAGDDDAGDSDGDGVCDDSDACPGTDDALGCGCGELEAWLTGELIGQPGSIVSAQSETHDSVAAWTTKQSNVVSRVLTWDRAIHAWHFTDLPWMYYGGKATLQTFAGADDVIWFSHPHPDGGNMSDRLYRYDAGVTGGLVETDLIGMSNDPGDIVADFVAVSPLIAGFHTKRSNVVARVFVHDRALDTWTITTLPGKSTGGATTLSAIAAAGDLLVTAYRPPQSGTNGDVLTLYQAGTGSQTTWETIALHPDPGDMKPELLAVTDDLVAFHTKRSNVVSRVLIYNRALDTWTVVTLPGMYYGGVADLLALQAAGPMLYFLYPRPESGAKGERIYMYDAGTDLLTMTDTQALDPAPGSFTGKLSVTRDLLALGTKFSNVYARIFLYSVASGTWRVESMPGKSSGGTTEPATLSAAGRVAAWTYRHPQTGTWGDVVSTWDAATDTLDSVATVDLQADPGDIITLRHTAGFLAAYTKRSNVTSRLFIRDHCDGAWQVETLPYKATGGTSEIQYMEASGGLLTYTYPDPAWPPNGDMIHVWEHCACP